MSWLRVRPDDRDRIDRRDLATIDWFRRSLSQPLRRHFSAEVRGLEHYIDGRALVVGNHNGGTLVPDTFVFGDAIAERFGTAAVPFGLTHEMGLRVPVVAELLMRLGGVRAAHHNAARLFAADHKVIVYPGGDVDAFRPYKERNRITFDGRVGYIRLALRHDVPILPVVAAGAHEGMIVLSDGRKLARAFRLDRWLRVKVLPLTLSVPWGLALGPIPPYFPRRGRMLIEVLAPERFERRGEAAAADEDYVRECDRRIRARLQRRLSELAVELARRAGDLGAGASGRDEGLQGQ